MVVTWFLANHIVSSHWSLVFVRHTFCDVCTWFPTWLYGCFNPMFVGPKTFKVDYINFKFHRSYTPFCYLKFGEISFVTSYPQRLLVAWCALLLGFIRFTTARFSARKRWRPRWGPRAFSHWRLPCWVPCVFTGAKLTNQCFNRFRMIYNNLHWQTKPPRWYSLHGRGTATKMVKGNIFNVSNTYWICPKEQEQERDNKQFVHCVVCSVRAWFETTNETWILYYKHWTCRKGSTHSRLIYFICPTLVGWFPVITPGALLTDLLAGQHTHNMCRLICDLMVTIPHMFRIQQRRLSLIMLPFCEWKPTTNLI